MTSARHSSTAPRRADYRSGVGARAVFPVPAQRLAVVAVGESEAAAPVLRMAERVGWPLLHVSDQGRMEWALTVNRPVLAVVVGEGDAAATRRVVVEARRVLSAPVVVLDDLTDAETVSVLVAGADNVLPPDLPEDVLTARLLAVVRRSADGSESGARYLASGRLRVDLWRHEATLDHQPLALTRIEYRLLVCLMEADGQVVPISRILSRVWGWQTQDGVTTLRSTMTRLRKKLAGPEPEYLCSVRGEGYRFEGRVTELADREARDGAVEASGELMTVRRLAAKCDALAEAEDVESAASRIAEALVAEGTVDAVGLHLVVGRSLQLVAHRGFSAAWEEAARELRLGDERHASIQMLASAEPLQVRRLQPRRFAGTAQACSAEVQGTYLFVPIRSGGRVVGSMGLMRHSQEPFGPMVIEYLAAVGGLCGVGLETRWRAVNGA